ncbi:MAG TPA: hypothetical protein VM557_13345 [Thermoanaerobaculia bacterium]|nr:hypothetical protein [Thermoanaerobaculia bacterium]
MNRTALLRLLVLFLLAVPGFAASDEMHAAIAEARTVALDVAMPPAQDHWCATTPAIHERARAERNDAEARRQIRAARRSTAATVSQARFSDGVVLVEADSIIAPHDHPLDLIGSILELTPVSGGFEAARTEIRPARSAGQKIATLANADASHLLELDTFRFPFFGTEHDKLHIHPFAVGLGAPIPMTKARQWGAADLASLPVPVVAAFLNRRSPALELFVAESTESLVLTWRNPKSDEEVDIKKEVDIQMVLESNGRITMRYGAIPVPRAGAAFVSGSGSGLWEPERAALARGTDSSTDVGEGVPVAFRPHTEIISLEVDRLGATDLLEFRLRLAGSPLEGTLEESDWIYWQIQLGNTSAERGANWIRLYRFPERGILAWLPQWYAGEGPLARVEGNELVVRISESILDLAGPATEVNASAIFVRDGRGIGSDSLQTILEGLGGGTRTLEADLSAAGGGVSNGPLFEAFTVPILNASAVWAAIDAEIDLNESYIDMMSIYQTFSTDLNLYAGGYSTVGNAAADGIDDFISLNRPKVPALLHLDTLGNGWNSKDLGILRLQAHEVGHRWLYFFSIREAGESTNHLNPDGGHPKKGVHLPAAFPTVTMTDHSTMGGSTFSQIGANEYRTPDDAGAYAFTWHELYLMGLAAPEEVSEPWYYLNGEGLETSYDPPVKTTFTTTSRTDVSFNQILDAMGPRVPSVITSPKKFVNVYVIVTRPGETLTDEVLADFRERYRDAFVEHFRAVTGGRGAIVTDPFPSGRKRGVRR